jgi:hypothetical protein
MLYMLPVPMLGVVIDCRHRCVSCRGLFTEIVSHSAEMKFCDECSDRTLGYMYRSIHEHASEMRKRYPVPEDKEEDRCL